MQNMAQMFGMARQESLQREEVLRSEIRSEICETAKATSKDAAGLAAQVVHLATTVNVLQSQLSTNAGFSVDALQQVREEFKAQIDAVSKNNQASNARGVMPHTGTGPPMARRWLTALGNLCGIMLMNPGTLRSAHSASARCRRLSPNTAQTVTYTVALGICNFIATSGLAHW